MQISSDNPSSAHNNKDTQLKWLPSIYRVMSNNNQVRSGGYKKNKKSKKIKNKKSKRRTKRR